MYAKRQKSGELLQNMSNESILSLSKMQPVNSSRAIETNTNNTKIRNLQIHEK